MIRPVVIVPVHLANPSPAEKISLRQCGKTLGQRDILFVAPEGLNLSDYHTLIPQAEVLRVNPHWMSSIEAYNRMMISPLLVDALAGYTHMLLHEPDAIVLGDEIDYWCSMPFDYIGAPWFEGYATAAPNARVIGVGNSGFSLHRLAALKRLMTSRQRWYPYRRIGKDLVRGIFGDGTRLLDGLQALTRSGQLRGAWQLFDGHCDDFWCGLVATVVADYKIADVDHAVRFSWEVLPDRCLAMSRGKLPFGIHAWAKYNPKFLLPYLEAAGVELR